MSIAGGVHNALHAGDSVGCEAIQIFTKSSRQWAAKPLSEEDILTFRETQKASGVHTVVAHDSYLLNLGAPDRELRQKSVDAFVDEMERCEALDIPCLIAHPGAHTGAGERAGLRTIARSLDAIHRRCAGFKVRVALEITAGQGTNLGYPDRVKTAAGSSSLRWGVDEGCEPLAWYASKHSGGGDHPVGCGLVREGGLSEPTFEGYGSGFGTASGRQAAAAATRAGTPTRLIARRML